MKRFILFAFIAGSTLVARSQSYEGTVQYDKKKQDAIVIEYGYPAEAVENAFIERMRKLGFQPKEEKGILNRDRGFLVFRKAYVPDISDRRLDYILKVERKSRKEEDESIMYLVMQDDGKNVLKTMEASSVGKARVYVNNMIPDIEVAHLELQIKAQEELVSKAEKKLRDLEDEHGTLTRKLEDNEKNQETTRADIDTQKKTLDILRGKRKPATTD